MHTASTASTYAQLPVLAAMIALFVLRDRDRLLSIDAMRLK